MVTAANEEVAEVTDDKIEKPKRRRRRQKADDATKTKRSTKRNAPQNTELDLSVDFQGVSIGDGTARVGVKISRNQLSLTKADQSLCGRRITGQIVLTPGGDDPDQTYMFDDLKHKIVSTFDIKSFSTRPDWFSCGITFALQEIDCRELGLFAKKQGRLIASDVQLIPGKADEKNEDEQT